MNETTNKMKVLCNIIVVFVGYLYIVDACPPNTICKRPRDTLVQSNWSLPNEIHENRYWIIKPSDEPFTAMLAFKNFSVEYSAVVLNVIDDQGQSSTRYLYGDLGDFEIILPGCAAILVHIHSAARPAARFVLNYYTGCTILTSSQDEINHIELTNRDEQQPQCWLIHPSDSDDRNRVYFSIRDVYLPLGKQLKIWDLHTSNLIVRTNSEDYAIVAAESQDIQYHQSIVVDYECFGSHCSDSYHAFFLTYYTMTHADSLCIEAQQTCSDFEITNGLCTFDCPALNNMIREEFSFQTHQPALPQVRAGIAYEYEESPHADIEQNCILPQRFCRCHPHVKKESFCAKSVKCLNLGPCTFACIYHKVTSCLKITILRSIKLL